MSSQALAARWVAYPFFWLHRPLGIRVLNGLCRCSETLPVRRRWVESIGADVEKQSIRTVGGELIPDRDRLTRLGADELAFNQLGEAREIVERTANRVRVEASRGPGHDLQRSIWSIVLLRPVDRVLWVVDVTQ